MSYRIAATNKLGTIDITLTGLIQKMTIPAPPTSFDFPDLGDPKSNTYSLSESQGRAIEYSGTSEVVRATNLLSCASVCYVSPGGIGYVYHANAGNITYDQFQAAINAVKDKAKNVYVAYAHQNNTGSGYQSIIGDLINWGVSTNKIIEITNLFINKFGMNNSFQIGY